MFVLFGTRTRDSRRSRGVFLRCRPPPELLWSPSGGLVDSLWQSWRSRNLTTKIKKNLCTLVETRYFTLFYIILDTDWDKLKEKTWTKEWRNRLNADAFVHLCSRLSCKIHLDINEMTWLNKGVCINSMGERRPRPVVCYYCWFCLWLRSGSASSAHLCRNLVPPSPFVLCVVAS